MERKYFKLEIFKNISSLFLNAKRPNLIKSPEL